MIIAVWKLHSYQKLHYCVYLMDIVIEHNACIVDLPINSSIAIVSVLCSCTLKWLTVS